MAKKTDDTTTETTTSTPPAETVPSTEPAKTAAPMPADPVLPLEQQEEQARAVKPFASVVEFPAHADGSNYHARQAQAALSQLGVEAQIVDTPPDGRTRQLLIDISASVQGQEILNETPAVQA